MKPPDPREPCRERSAEDTSRPLRLLAWTVLGSGALLACQAGLPAGPGWTPELSQRTAALERVLDAAPTLPSPGALRVRLAFEAVGDLDLFVTDPLQETVYFANSPTRSGGRMTADLRCDAPAPRIETVVFPAPIRGRYRVGVDFPERCPGHSGDAVFVVSLESAGAARRQRGRIVRGEFQPIVLESEIPLPREPAAGDPGNKF